MRPEAPPERTSTLLERIAREDGHPDISLGELLDRFDGRAFGVLVVIATLPAFLPTPIGAGAIAGPLVVLLGLQMAWGLQHPWLPQWLRRRSFARVRLARFLDRLGDGMARVERLCRPRAPLVLNGAGWRLTGGLMALHGLALSLPVPLTNYPFGFVLVMLAIALVERDGVLVAACWALMLACVGVVLALGDAIIETVQRYAG